MGDFFENQKRVIGTFLLPHVVESKNTYGTAGFFFLDENKEFQSLLFIKIIEWDE